MNMNTNTISNSSGGGAASLSSLRGGALGGCRPEVSGTKRPISALTAVPGWAPPVSASKRRKPKKKKNNSSKNPSQGLGSRALVAQGGRATEIARCSVQIGAALLEKQWEAALKLLETHARALLEPTNVDDELGPGGKIWTEMVAALIAHGRVTEALKTLTLGKSVAPFAHRSLLLCLLDLPQDLSPHSALLLLDALVRASRWPSERGENYFSTVAGALLLEFGEEASSILGSLTRAQGGAPLVAKTTAVSPRAGGKLGELDCGVVVLSEENMLFPTDCVALIDMQPWQQQRTGPTQQQQQAFLAPTAKCKGQGKVKGMHTKGKFSGGDSNIYSNSSNNSSSNMNSYNLNYNNNNNINCSSKEENALSFNETLASSYSLLECEVLCATPLLLRAQRSDHPILKSIADCSEQPKGSCGNVVAGRYRLLRLANRTGLRRMLAALHSTSELDRWSKEEKLPHRLPHNHRPSEEIRQALIDPKSFKSGVASELVPEVLDLIGNGGRSLNDSQRKAATASLSDSISLVQGPPGTGKTATCVEVLRLWIKTWRKPRKKSCLLASSDSNVAVDNLLEGLLRAGVRAVRLGHPDKAQPALLEHTADIIAAKNLGVSSLKDLKDHYQARDALQKVIESSEVVCCTSIGAGAGLLQDFWFPLVLVDEASQATEPATLVPLCRGSERAVLVGDQCQLPPTVTSQQAAAAGLTVSLFERLHRGGLPSTLLSCQYRMHPSLAHFPGRHFYDGQLIDGVAAGMRPPAPGFAWPNPEVPAAVVPVNGSEVADGTSFTNDAEATRIVGILQQFLQAGLRPTDVGIIAPYGSQVRLIRQQLQRARLPTGRERGGVEVGSVDGFQGREKEVILVSTVRASPGGGLGFVTDWRRANVALTRARRGLVIVCHPQSLARDTKTWLPWLHWAKSAGCDGGMLPALPALKATSSTVGLSAQLEAAPSLSNFDRPPRPLRQQSPEPEWRRQSSNNNNNNSSISNNNSSGKAFGSSLAASVAGSAAKAMPKPKATPVKLFRPLKHLLGRAPDDEEEDDRDDETSEAAGHRQRLRRPTGNSQQKSVSSSLGSLGYGGYGPRAAAKKGADPSPFLGGAKLNLEDALLTSLGVQAPPVANKKAAAAASKAKKKRKKKKKKQTSGLLGAYASSSEDSDDEDNEEDEDEDEDDDDDESNEDAGQRATAKNSGKLSSLGSAAVPPALGSSDEDDDDEDEEDDDDDDEEGDHNPKGNRSGRAGGWLEESSEDSDGLDLLGEFMH